MNAPGSPSSPLQMTYLVSLGCLRTMRHFWPVGNPAPPRPRKPDFSIMAMISSGGSVAQVSKPAVSRVSEPAPVGAVAAWLTGRDTADLEVGDTAGLET